MTPLTTNLPGNLILENIRKFYDTGTPLYMTAFGEHFHDGYYLTGKESTQEAQENLIILLANQAGIKSGDRVLDVGCGVGGSSIWLAKNRGAVTTGITISPVQLEIARKLAAENQTDAAFLLMDAENMRLAERFDIVWTVAAITHFRDPEQFIKSAASLLNKGGKIIIYDWMTNERVLHPHDRDVQRVTEGMLLPGIFTMNDYLKWFTDNGYRITYSEDVTSHTIKTWDNAISVFKKPGALKLIFTFDPSRISAIFHFLNSVAAMKSAMRKGKIRSGIIIGEKI